VSDLQICVPLADLAGTARALALVEERLAGATRRVGSLDLQEAGFVAPDLESFADHWDHGVTTLRHGVGALRTALEQVRDAYDSHERELVAHFRPSTGSRR